MIGFGHFDKETVYINAPIDFGTTHYYLNVFIEWNYICKNSVFYF